MSVTATDPDSATQDTTLDVVVSGSGFDQGSQAQWTRAGVPSINIRTNSTRFVTPKQLIANITVAAVADTGLYDVAVTTSTGKKGIGSELFTVHKKGEAEPADPEIVYVDDVATTRTLFVVNASGSNRTSLGVSVTGSASWAGYGNGSATSPYRVLFDAGPTGDGRICSIGIVDVDTVGGTPRALNERRANVPPPYYACGPVWSPVTDTIAFGGSQEGSVTNGIYLIPVTGGAPELIYASLPGAYPFQPAWSPDGSAIAFIESNETSWALRVLNRATGVTTTIVAAGVLDYPKFPDWSRDGSRLALQASRQVRIKNRVQYRTSVYIVTVAVDGDGNHVAVGSPRFVGDGARPSWSPDGSVLVVDGLHVLNVATGSVQGLTSGSFADWRR